MSEQELDWDEIHEEAKRRYFKYVEMNRPRDPQQRSVWRYPTVMDFVKEIQRERTRTRN